MINHLLGDATLSGHSATGIIESMTANQLGLTGIGVNWVYAGQDENSVYFLVYVNGRFVKRVPGFERSTDVIAMSYDSQDVQVIPWRTNMPPPDDLYGAIHTSRAHLEWSRPSDPSISGYRIYISDTLAGTYEVYAEHNKPALQTGLFPIGSSGTMEIMGSYNVMDEHTNTTFTVTITDASAHIATLSNNKTMETSQFIYSPGVPLVLFPGVVCVLDGAVNDNDSASFCVGVQPYFDSLPLSDGVHYFKVATMDAAGHETLSSAVPVLIQSPPAPVTEFELYYDEDSESIEARGVQSITPNATDVKLYTNWDSKSESFMPGVFFVVPHHEISVSAGQPFSSIFLTDAGSMPAGELQVVPVSVTSSGVEDGTATVYTMTFPYTPPSLPATLSLRATAIQDGGLRVSWLSDFAPPQGPSDEAGEWEIAISATDGLSDVVVYARPIPEDYFGRMSFTHDVPGTSIGPEGEYEVTVRSVSLNGSYFGAPSTITVQTDSTPPDAITDITGVGF